MRRVLYTVALESLRLGKKKESSWVKVGLGRKCHLRTNTDIFTYKEIGFRAVYRFKMQNVKEKGTRGIKSQRGLSFGAGIAGWKSLPLIGTALEGSCKRQRLAGIQDLASLTGLSLN